MNNSRIVPITLIVLLSVVSFYTSFEGLKNFAFINIDNASRIGLIILGILVLCIQLFLVYSLHRMAKAKRFLPKIKWLAPYLIMMLVSVFFSYGFYYKLIRADTYAKEKFTVQLSQAKDNAQKYLAAFEAIQNGGNHLQQYSLSRSNEEKQFGGTCGDDSPPGKGPREKFRLREAAQFKYIAQNINPLVSRVKSEIRDLEEAIDSYSPDIQDLRLFQRDINAIVSRINNNNFSPVLMSTKEEIKRRVGRNRNRIISNNIGCPDDAITKNGRTMLKNISNLPILQEVQLFDPNDDRAVLTRAMVVFKEIPKVIIEYFISKADASRNSTKKENILIKPSDYTPLLLGVVVDSMLLIIGVTNGLKSRQNNWLSANFDGEFFSVSDANKIKKTLGLRYVVEVLQPHLVKVMGGYFFIIPNTAIKNHPLSGRLLGMFEVLEIERIKPVFARNIPFSWIPSAVKNNMKRLYSTNIDDEQAFNFYRMTADQWRDFKQAFTISNA